MSKKTVIDESALEIPQVFLIKSRVSVFISHREIDTTFETEQGQEQTVEKLYNDYVLGRLDPRQLGGGDYDDDNSDELDPFNKPGLTFEEATQIADAGRNAAQEVKRSGSVADHPINNSKTSDKEEQHEQPKE